MNHSFDTRLQRSGRVALQDADVEHALNEVIDHAKQARPARRPHRLVLAVSLSAALALAAPVAVAAAMQWAPWVVTEPDIVVTRSWVDVEGVNLGSCESRLAMEDLPEDAREDALAYFAALDVDAVEPDGQAVAAGLNGLGRLGEIGRLIPGAAPSDFDVTHHGPLLDAAFFTDVYLLQDGLMVTITEGMTAEISPANPEAFQAGVMVTSQTQCTPATGATQP